MACVRILSVVAWSALLTSPGLPHKASADELPAGFLNGDFRWNSTGPLVSPAKRPDDPCISVKDPTIVQHEGRWHLFCTIRSEKRSHQIEYLSFEKWNQADAAERHVLKLTDGYFCAPQVFYFRPHKKWYLIYQVAHPQGKDTILPAFSTSDRIDDPQSWTKPELLFAEKPEHVSSWIDYWVICDDQRAHLFFTSNDGRMWRCDTPLDQFPKGWSAPQVVLKGDIFEASHTYRLKGSDKYLTVIEAEGEGGRRYYKAYLADRLEGPWTPLADTAFKPFAAPGNVSGHTNWTNSYSHGELIRTGTDERLEIDPDYMEFLFQGVADVDRVGKPYGQIPWRLGILRCNFSL